MELMLKKLELDSKKVLAPSREQMINMLLDASKRVDVGKDFLVSDKLFSLIGDDMLDFQ